MPLWNNLPRARWATVAWTGRTAKGQRKGRCMVDGIICACVETPHGIRYVEDTMPEPAPPMDAEARAAMAAWLRKECPLAYVKKA